MVWYGINSSSIQKSLLNSLTYTQHSDEIRVIQDKHDALYQENVQVKKDMRAYERQLQELGSDLAMTKNQLSSLESEHARARDENSRAVEDYRARIKKVSAW